MFFEARGGVQETWHFMSGSRSVTCPGQKGVKHELSGAHE